MFLVGRCHKVVVGFSGSQWSGLSAGWSSPLWPTSPPPFYHLTLTRLATRCCFLLGQIAGVQIWDHFQVEPSACVFCFFFPSPHLEPQTTQQQWSWPYPNKESADREALTSVPFALTSTLHTKIVPSDQKALCMIGHGVWGFTHLDVCICSTLLPSFWRLVFSFYTVTCLLNFGDYRGLNSWRIGPGWGYVLFIASTACTNLLID